MHLPDYKTFIYVLSKTAHFCGVNIFDPNYKCSILTFWIGFLQIICHLASFYSMIDAWPDMEQLIKSLSTYGICIQVHQAYWTFLLALYMYLFYQIAVKFYAYIFGHRKFQKLYIRVEALHKNTINQSKEEQTVISECLGLIIKVALFICVTYFLAIFFFWLYPIYAYFYQHKRELMFGLRCPFIDDLSLRGYTITMIFQLVFEIYGMIGMSWNDSMSMMLVFYTIGFNGLLCVDLQKFGDFLKKDEQKERHKIKEMLKKILLKHQEQIE